MRRQGKIDRSSLATEESSSSPSPLLAIQALLSRSKRLPTQLWDIVATSTFQCNDYISLAGTVNQLSTILSQLMLWLQKDSNILSQQAWQDLCDISDQCHSTFNRIEEVAMAEGRSPSGTMDLAVGNTRSTNTLSSSELVCMGALLDGLSSTLNVMIQIFSLGQTILSYRYHPIPESVEVVGDIRQMIQNLFINQQMTLLRASRLAFQLQVERPTTPPGEVSRSPGSRYLRPDTQLNLTIQAIARYQERILLQPQSETMTQAQSMALIRQASTAGVEDLLQKWTKVTEEKTLNPESNMRTRRIVSPEELERRRSLQPSVESDNETQSDPRNRRSLPLRGNPGPLLEPVGGGNSRNAMPILGAPPMARHYSSPPSISGPAPSRKQQGQTVDGYSPYSASLPLANHQVRKGPASVASTYSSTVSDPLEALDIPWRRRLDKSKWDFRDDLMVKSNTTLSPEAALRDARTVTEIRETWIHPEALRERRLLFKLSKENVGDSHRTKTRSFFRIEKALTFAEVEDIVKRTAQICKEQQEEQKERRMSSGSRRSSMSRSYTDSSARRRSSMIPPWAPTEEDLHEALENYDQPRQGQERSKKDRRDSVHFASDSKEAERPKLERRYSTRENYLRGRVSEEDSEIDRPARTPSRSRKESDARRSRYEDYDDDYDERGERDGRDGRDGRQRRGSKLIDLATQSASVVAPAAGLATLLVRGLAAM